MAAAGIRGKDQAFTTDSDGRVIMIKQITGGCLNQPLAGTVRAPTYDVQLVENNI